MAGLETLKLLSTQTTYRSERKGKTHDPITAHDVAGAMADVSRDAQLLAYLKYVQDKSVDSALFYSLYQKVADLANEQGWEIPRGREYLRNMTRLSMIEVVEPLRCVECEGRKLKFPKNAAPHECRRCDGTGRRRIRASERARLIGMDKAAWSRRWQARYEKVYKLLTGYEGDIARALRRHFTI